MLHALELLPPQLLYVGTVELVLIVLAAHLLTSRRRNGLFRAAVLLLFASIALFFVLNCGYLAVPRPPDARRPDKVFGIGLSRTGTTSLTVALHRLGYSTYHALGHLLRLPLPLPPRAPAHSPNATAASLDAARRAVTIDPYWADAYDAQTDIHPAIVYKALAERYPRARFIYNTRDPDEWARAMTRFMGKHALLWRALDALHFAGLSFVPPADSLFRIAYGEWSLHTTDAWREIYLRHDHEVRHFFRPDGPHAGRMLPISFVRGEGWAQLAPFLGIDVQKALDRDKFAHLGLDARAAASAAAAAFPRADVFDVSAKAQPLWQLQNLVSWFL